MKTLAKNVVVGIFAIGCAIALNGCVFNVDRISKQKTGEESSIGLVKAAIDMSGYSGDITANGTTDSLVKATVSVSEMVKTDSDKSAIDELSVSITNSDSIGRIGFSFSDNKDLWEQLRLESVALSCNNSLGITAKTISGNINVTGMNGYIDLETTSGNVSADVVDGCKIKVISGDVNVSLKPDSSFHLASIETTSGDITVHVVNGLKANLELKTTSGSIHTPSDNKSLLNGGDSLVIINCKAMSGDIKIEEDK
jgi:DUF4097 and DUF4098 domain-containing protein YvlB